MTPKIAIIGKPNVGKSTLFNKLCKKRLAITNDMPGVTRDRKEYVATLGKREIKLIDTAGLENSKNDLSKNMLAQTLNAAEEANIILFMVDLRNGIDADDKNFAKQIRKLGKKIILVANKCEGKSNSDINDIFKLGFGEPIQISAEHGIGFHNLEESIFNSIDTTTNTGKDVEESENDKSETLKIALIGRPNVGKSTIFNKLLGFDRVITSEVAGTTRDSISYNTSFQNRDIELIDTAGLRKKSKVVETIESLSTVETINAIRRCHVAILVLDANQPLEKQDLSIANLAINEGRSIILVVNKSDLIEDKKAYEKELRYVCGKTLSDIHGISIIYISALHDSKITNILKVALKSDLIWRSKFSTNKINKWLQHTTETHAPPLSKSGRRIKLKYITQTGVKPPTFTIFCNVPSDLPDSYSKYLKNSLRESLDLYGTPIRIKFRRGENPYSTKK